MAEAEKRRFKLSDSWRAARSLIVAHRWRLALGAVLMLVNRLVGFVLPASSKYIIDEVIGQGRGELLALIALAAGVAAMLQAFTSFALSQILGLTAERVIAELRKRIQVHVGRLPMIRAARASKLRLPLELSFASTDIRSLLRIHLFGS
jgi:ABC-type bacteriocin/lantibiotic exporter with double-glycine peptidase domain